MIKKTSPLTNGILWGMAAAGLLALPMAAHELHVATNGNDSHPGTAEQPLRTIQAAANRAQPGDTVTVHAGIYRERVDPPRGGTSDDKRITYQAAPGARVVIKGSEPVKGWTHVTNHTWKVVLPNAFFSDFNPFADPIHGDWFIPKERPHHTGAVHLDGHWLTEAAAQDAVLTPAGKAPLWFAHVSHETTTLWAQFPDVENPNNSDVEINVRQSVFYPSQPGMHYLTVRGFTMEQAATPWAPPTAEQIGLIGTHWSKGWIIEKNDIRYSTCTGITLGKHGDEFDNTSADTAEGYVMTIERAIARGWTRDTVGSHIVRNNRISHCEQAGLVGSLGAIFSTITGNVIHDIHVRQLFTGHEQAGIKLHAPIDTLISHNHIHRTSRGIWLDWMTQGTHVTRNLLHDNHTNEDLFIEVNHGPFLVDHNICLSRQSLNDWSQGGAYAHNLFAGAVLLHPVLDRKTPFHKAHSTEIAGLENIPGGDSRFYNNIFTGDAGLSAYDSATRPMHMAGNVFLAGAKPSKHENAPTVMPSFDPAIRLQLTNDAVALNVTLDHAWAAEASRTIVNTELLGKAIAPNLPFVQPDGATHRLERDYFGMPRNPRNPFPGPFENPETGTQTLNVWPN
jgi:alpha-L-arabinofuranosidase